MLTATIENLLNRGLPASPRAQQLCAELAGRTVAVEVSELVRVIVESTGHSLKLTLGQAAAEAEVIGGPFGLLALGGDTPDAVLQRGDVQIRGDAELAQRFRELALLLRPDAEEELSRLIGDVPAHQIGRLARGTLRWARRAGITTVRNFAEYLGHEQRDLVPRAEGDQFLHGVDALREDVDRLEARIRILTQSAGTQPSGQRGA